MTTPQNQVAKLPGNHPFSETKTFLRLIEVQAKQDVAFGQLSQALHELHTTITANQPTEIDEGTLVAQFAAVMTEAMILNPLISTIDAIVAANKAFQAELVNFIGQVHLINHPPPQDDRTRTLAIAAGGALLGVGAFAIGPALALGALEVVGFRSLAAAAQSAVYGGAVTSGSLFALCQGAAMGGIAAGAAQVAAGIAALGAAAGLLGAAKAKENGPNADMELYQNRLPGGRRRVSDEGLVSA
ncbi:hypothetical protein FS837_005197 [Tulasnella sp. UAMH 9824]|nr:hypothetical protein FS837_005197 [Tulasnella sp. UAMH 9824]